MSVSRGSRPRRPSALRAVPPLPEALRVVPEPVNPDAERIPGFAPTVVGPPRRGHVSEVAAILSAARSAVLLAHVNPDADSLGSALALGLALESRGVDVSVRFGYPQQVPESLRELPGQHLIAGSMPVRPDVVVSVDVASTERLGRYSKLLAAAPVSIVLDHHASNPAFGTVNWIDAHAEATVVLVAQLLDELGLPITPDIATNLYAGLATDTVHFRLAGTSAHQLAVRLLETGIQPTEIMRPITDTHPFGWLGMLGRVLSKAKLLPEAAGGAGLVLVSIDLDDATGLRQEELDSVIDIVRTTSEAAVAVVAKQTAASEWQVSLRAKPPVDVGQLATDLGGGGHRGAAGYTFRGEPAALVRELQVALARLR